MITRVHIVGFDDLKLVKSCYWASGTIVHRKESQLWNSMKL